MTFISRQLGIALSFVFLAGMFVTQPAAAQNIEAQEQKLDETIQSACHSYLVDAIPDALSWLKGQIYENSPFCKRVNSAYDSQDINDAMKDQFARVTSPGGTLDLSKKHDRDLKITIECKSEYMCMESRLRFLETANPVSQKQYGVVAEYCDGRYGCIQSFFDRWPTSLPTIRKAEKDKLLTFSSILDKPQQAASTAVNPSVSSQQVFVTSGAKPTQENLAVNRKVARQCDCSLAGRPCFDNPYGPIRKRLAKIEEQRLSVCQAWQETYEGIGETQSVNNERMKAEVNYSHKYIRDADKRGENIIYLAKEDFERITYRARKRLPFRDTFEHRKADRLASGPSVSVGATPIGFGQSSVAQQRKTVVEQVKGQEKSGSKIVYSPQRLTWKEAGAFCAGQGMHLPTVQEAKKRLKELTQGDPYFGIWTTDRTQPDRLSNRYRTLRSIGTTEGANIYQKHRVFCFS